MLLNPRRLEGFGLNDGEQLERFWAYLRPFARVIKEQTPAHRLDTLAMACLHYILKKANAMGIYQMKKLFIHSLEIDKSFEPVFIS